MKNMLLAALFIPALASIIGYGAVLVESGIKGHKYHFSILGYFLGCMMVYLFSKAWVLSFALIVASFFTVRFTRQNHE
jgi:hypothetical protein